MDFQLSEEQVAIQDAIRGTLASTLPSERLHALVDDDEGPEIDRESWDALMALGVGGLHLPEDYGGAGLGLLDAAIACEVAGECAATGPLADHLVTGLAIATGVSDELKSAWLPKIASGEVVATLAWSGDWLPETWTLTESNASISGEAGFVTGAGQANVMLAGLYGGELALVEPGDGVSVQRLKSSDRTRRQSAITFENAPAAMLDSDVGRIFDAALVLQASDALGGAQKTLDMTVAYAREREQFGQPIGKFQALKHQLAQIALEVEPARALVWYAAYAWDENLDDARKAAAIANAHLTETFNRTIRAAVAAHGGIGYTWEYDLSFWVKRAFYDRAVLGSPAAHRARAADLSDW